MHAFGILAAAVIVLAVGWSAWRLQRQKAASGGTRYRIRAPLAIALTALSIAVLVARIAGV